MARQFQILEALGPTEVRSPPVFWYEPTGDVLGRDFYVMARVDGTVYERGVPDELTEAPARVRRMCAAMVEQVAAIHRVDLAATGLGAPGDGDGYLARELERWHADVERVKRGPLPQLERIHAELLAGLPEQSPRSTLVHGDPKPGNFAFVDDEVTAVFDWEMSAVGDPRADLGWLEFNWAHANPLTLQPGALTLDEAAAYWSELTGIEARDRAWHRAMQGYKCVVIMLLGVMLYDRGASDDARFAAFGGYIAHFTGLALAELGVTEPIDPGPVTALRSG